MDKKLAKALARWEKRVRPLQEAVRRSTNITAKDLSVVVRSFCLLALAWLLGCEQKADVHTKAAQCTVYDQAGNWKGTTWSRQGPVSVTFDGTANGEYHVKCFVEDEDGTFTTSIR